MTVAVLGPEDEAVRLDRLRELFILDSPPEAVFDGITRLASEICGAPIALISLVDAQRQWFKANIGLQDVNETPRDIAFCAHALGNDALLEIPDATQDPRFAANPMVTGAPDIRFYAGAPLILPDGARVGTLCVIDRQARHLDPAQAAMLRSLAAIASQALVMRRDLINKSMAVRSEFEAALASSERRYRAIVEDQAELVSLARPDGHLVYVNPAYARHFGRTPQQMIGSNLFDWVQAADVDAVRTQIANVLLTGQSLSNENRMVAADGSERWVAWTNMVQRDAGQPPLLHSVGRDVSERKYAEIALRASEDFLLRTGRTAGVGGWQLDLAAGSLLWSEQTRRIHEVDADYVPSLDTAIAFYPPAARPQIEAAVRRAMDNGKPWDLELPFITAKGREIWVRAVGEAEFEGDRPVRLVGAFQDITERKSLEQRVADNERFVRQIIDNTTDYVVQADWRGHITYMNPAVRQALGLTPDEAVSQRNFAEFNTALTNQAFAQVVVPAVKASGVWLGESSVCLAGRNEVPVSQIVIGHLDAVGRVERYSAVMRDISVEVQAKRELYLQTATLRSITEAIPAIIAVVGIDGRYRFVNSGFERWIGSPRDRIIGRTLAEVLGRSDYERSRPWVERVLSGESVSFERDYPGGSGTRHLAVSYIPLWLDSGVVDGFVGVAQDVTETRREEVRLLQLAQRDALTGLLNRAGFEQVTEHRLKDEGGSSLALLYIDLDHFKPVNDRHGHPVGDQVLKQFAQRLKSLVRPTDAVARLGGDEFALLLSGVREPAHARAVADKVLEAAGTPFVVGSLHLQISASLGVALGVDPARGWDELVARADAMLYRAKAAGRGRQVGETQ